APRVAAAVTVPLIHVIDVTADAILAAGLDTVALLGTGYTMRDPFYRDHMAARGVTTLVPPEEQIAAIHSIIYDELARGVIRDESHQVVVDATEALVSQGAQGVIAGCTEIPLIMTPDHMDVPYFDSMELHVNAALEFSLDGRA